MDKLLSRLPFATDWGLLILRIAAGGAMLTHGWAKLSHFAEKAPEFMNFLGIGSTTSLALVVFAEFFCSILLIVGLFTRWATIPLIITMKVAIFMVHWQDGFGKSELAFLYLAIYALLFFTGAGKYSIDAFWRKQQTK